MKRSVLIFSLFLLAGVSFCLLGYTSQCRATEEDPVLATVNGVEITLSQFRPVIKEYREKTNKTEVKTDEKLQMLKGIIRRHLILDQPEAQELRASERIAQQVRGFEDKLVLTAFLENHVGRHLTANTEEIKEFYLQNMRRFSAPPKVVARHILVRSREEAEQVLVKLRNGADFKQMARENSIDLPMALEGGPMGTIERGRSLPELERVLFILDVGEISDVVETRFGFHILTVDEIIPTSFRSLEEVKEAIRKAILQQKEAKAFDEMAAKLEKDATIEVFDERLKLAE